MQRFTWLFAALIMWLAAPMFTQAQPASASGFGTLDLATNESQRDLHWTPCACS